MGESELDEFLDAIGTESKPKEDYNVWFMFHVSFRGRDHKLLKRSQLPDDAIMIGYKHVAKNAHPRLELWTRPIHQRIENDFAKEGLFKNPLDQWLD